MPILRACITSALLAVALGGTATATPRRTVFPHPQARWWVSGQLNVINQFHPGFRSPYSGINSLSAPADDATSIVGTVFGGLLVTSTTELLIDGESAGGGGVGQALGVGGFSNLDVVRNPTLGSAPYLARAIVHQIIPLGDAEVDATRGPLSGFARLPRRRLEIRAGKMSTADTFDVNALGSDSHLQFMNWAVDNNGSYDYAADTRGYTLGAVTEYDDPAWSVRVGEMLMPSVANGIDYDFGIAHARGEQVEVEHRGQIDGRDSVVRVLGYLNHAAMGSYRAAIDEFRAGAIAAPDITTSRAAGRTKIGAGLNAEQALTTDLSLFGRAGWADGKNEAFAYTEIDNTLELGGTLRGARWHRPDDRLGVAVVTNGLSSFHREYLKLGGHGFLLGDGTLHYGRENITEVYYTAHLPYGISPAADLQVIRARLQHRPRPGRHRVGAAARRVLTRAAIAISSRRSARRL
ncbi:MAG: carbohydrate porin [Deltaproteobacteria bacterium]|nr:carbohydrate porin [Deltaproteobacteria bacterium]